MRKLLVIDDNLDFLGFLASGLEKYFEVYTATGVKEALRLLEQQKVEAICSDFHMQAWRYTPKRDHRALSAYVRG